MSSSDSSFSVIDHVSMRPRVQSPWSEPLHPPPTLLHNASLVMLLGLGRLTLLLLSLLLGSLLSSSTASGSGTTSSRSGSTTARADVQEQVLDVLALKSLGEESGPDGLDVGNLGGRDQGVDLVGLRVTALVSLLVVPRKIRSRSHDQRKVYACAWGGGGRGRTVISTPSSARMRAA